MIQNVLLENRLLLFGVWMLAQLALISVWSWRRTRAANRAVWVGLLALPVLLLLSTVIVTQRERIMSLCRSMARDVERGDIAPIADRLDPQFQAAALDREVFLEHLEPALARFGVGKVRLSRFRFTFPERDTATAEFTAVCNVRTADAFFDRVLSRWRVRFVRRRGNWYLTSVEALPTPLSPVRNLRDWIR